MITQSSSFNRLSLISLFTTFFSYLSRKCQFNCLLQTATFAQNQFGMNHLMFAFSTSPPHTHTLTHIKSVIYRLDAFEREKKCAKMIEIHKEICIIYQVIYMPHAAYMHLYIDFKSNRTYIFGSKLSNRLCI